MFLQAVGFAVEFDDLTAMDEAVDDSDHAGGVGENLAPLGKRFIGGDDGGALLVASGDDLEE